MDTFWQVGGLAKYNVKMSNRAPTIILSDNDYMLIAGPQVSVITVVNSTHLHHIHYIIFIYMQKRSYNIIFFFCLLPNCFIYLCSGPPFFSPIYLLSLLWRQWGRDSSPAVGVRPCGRPGMAPGASRGKKVRGKYEWVNRPPRPDNGGFQQCLTFQCLCLFSRCFFGRGVFEYSFIYGFFINNCLWLLNQTVFLIFCYNIFSRLLSFMSIFFIIHSRGIYKYI